MARKSKGQQEIIEQINKVSENEQIILKLESWYDDPVSFFREALNVTLTNQQIELVNSVKEMRDAKLVVNLNPKIATERQKELASMLGISVHSGKGLGKDFTVAGLIIWFLALQPNFKGICTAPSQKQLEDILSSEVRKLLKEAPELIKDMISVDKSGMWLVNNNKKTNSFVSKRTANIKGDSAQQGEALAGLHADFLVAIADEASGLPDGVFKPLESTLTGMCNFAILIGNPTKNTGYYFRTHFDEKESKQWLKIRWDAEESNLEDINPGIKAQIKRMEEKFGRDSNPFRISVLGLPPLVEQDALIPLDWIQDCVDRDIEFTDEDSLTFGIDIGRGGDKSIIIHRRGRVITKISENSDVDSTLVTSWVARECDSYEPNNICIDTCGIGWGVSDPLNKMGYYNYAVDVGRSANDKLRFQNMRAELFMKLRDIFQARGISIPADEELIYELCSIKVKRWEPSLLLLDKKAMKAQGLSSPNKADALALTFYVEDLGQKAKSKLDKYEEDYYGNASGGWMRC